MKKVKHHYSTHVKSRNKDLAVYLVEHGADVNKRDENGDTPLFYANESGHINLIRYIKKIYTEEID